MSFPRCRDGLILFTHSSFGTFPIWHEEADLWMFDPKTGEAAPVDELNSDGTESFLPNANIYLAALIVALVLALGLGLALRKKEPNT